MPLIFSSTSHLTLLCQQLRPQTLCLQISPGKECFPCSARERVQKASSGTKKKGAGRSEESWEHSPLGGGDGPWGVRVPPSSISYPSPSLPPLPPPPLPLQSRNTFPAQVLEPPADTFRAPTCSEACEAFIFFFFNSALKYQIIIKIKSTSIYCAATMQKTPCWVQQEIPK